MIDDDWHLFSRVRASTSSLSHWIWSFFFASFKKVIYVLSAITLYLWQAGHVFLVVMHHLILLLAPLPCKSGFFSIFYAVKVILWVAAELITFLQVLVFVFVLF